MEAGECGCPVIHHWDPSLSPDEKLCVPQDELSQITLTSSNVLHKMEYEI